MELSINQLKQTPLFIRILQLVIWLFEGLSALVIHKVLCQIVGQINISSMAVHADATRRKINRSSTCASNGK